MSNYIYLQEVEERYKTEKLYNAALKRGDSDVIRFYEKAVDIEAAISKSDARLEVYPVKIKMIKREIFRIVTKRQPTPQQEEINWLDGVAKNMPNIEIGQVWASNATLMRVVVTKPGPVETRVSIVNYTDGQQPGYPLAHRIDTEILLSNFHLQQDPWKEKPDVE